MNHKLTSILAALCVIAATMPDCPAKPNLLLITVDDMNFDSVGAFGCRVEGITPHIDRLAEHGMCFDRRFVTVAICHPTRAVWMTGRYPQRNGALGFDPIKADVPSLPEALKAGGYYTAILGKAIHVVPSRHHAFDMIKDQNELGAGRDPALYAAEFRAAIASAKAAGKPFFMMANAHDPHRPFAGSDQEKWRPRPATRRTFRPDEVPVPGFFYIWNGWADGTRVFRNESQSGRTMSAMREAAKNDPEIARRVSFFLHRCTEELYDVQNDPDCLNNLIGLEGNPMGPVASAMTKQLWHWMKDTNDPQRSRFEKQVELALD